MHAAYAAITTLADALAAVAPDGDGKVVRSLRARRGLIARIQSRARQVRDPSRPLIWFHAPSVGEGLQARPVLHALRDAHPTWQFAYTFFSPSAERFAESLAADFTEYLPFDRARHADALLDAWQPSILVFSKLDVWPVLVARAAARGIPVVLISATVADGSGRLGWWSRQLLGDAYSALTSVGAIDSAHAERLVSLGVSRDAIGITGDTRFDQVWARANASARPSSLLARLASTAPTLVAGSTWPADEAVLLRAWTAIHANTTQRMATAGSATVGSATTRTVRLVIAPHEPTPAHCATIERWAQQSSLHLRRLSDIEADLRTAPHHAQADAPADNVDVVLVDRTGVLGDLYALADIAFVGGGFHSAGLHSVIEAAAFGVPALFGPQHHMSREAQLLLSAGAAYAVRNASELQARIEAWLSDGARREEAGAAARDVVVREGGATERSAALIVRHVEREGREV
jgi:3-deoxy-D-manno-octulosonic-acid transferase